MRFLIHLVGDVHQPLHPATLFSDDYPTGDMGGTLIEIKYEAKQTLKQLHAYWDSTANKISAEIQVVSSSSAYQNSMISYFQPITDDIYDRLQLISSELIEKWPRESLKAELRLKYFEDWVIESTHHAFETAYDQLRFKSGSVITPEYEQKARELIDHQLVLGGYRLADSLSELFRKEEEPKMTLFHLISGLEQVWDFIEVLTGFQK